MTTIAVFSPTARITLPTCFVDLPVRVAHGVGKLGRRVRRAQRIGRIGFAIQHVMPLIDAAEVEEHERALWLVREAAQLRIEQPLALVQHELRLRQEFVRSEHAGAQRLRVLRHFLGIERPGVFGELVGILRWRCDRLRGSTWVDVHRRHIEQQVRPHLLQIEAHHAARRWRRAA